MKIITNILRILVGGLFIFSGLIKSNDPTGFSYKLDEYFSVFAEDLQPTQDSVLFVADAMDETRGFRYQIVQQNPTMVVEALNSDWQKIPTGDDILDSISLGTAVVKINGTEIINETLNPTDSGSTLLSVSVIATVNGESVLQKDFDFKSYESNEDRSEINLSQYVKESSTMVEWLQKLRSYVIPLAILICVFEILLGFALLIGFAPKITLWLLLLMIVFFTFLTWYSANFEKVTDCGCFGDAIPLTPWESFYKDVILFIGISILFIGRKHINEIFSTPFAVRLLTVLALLSFGFAFYCWYYLPVKDFLKFKVGNDIEFLSVVPPGAPVDEYGNIFIYSKDGLDERFTLEQMSGRNLKEEGYEFVDRIDTLLSKGYEPAIHDFKMLDEDRETDLVDSFFADTSYKLLIVINDIDYARVKAMPTIKSYLNPWKKAGFNLYFLTASGAQKVDAFRHEHQISEPFYYGDKTNLKSIIRSNPGVLLLDGNVVIATWPATRLPDIDDLLERTK